MSSSHNGLVLSKHNAKRLRARNAIDAATLDKETRQLQKEKNSEERLFLKNRKHILQRQSSLVGELTPKLRDKESVSSTGGHRLLSASSLRVSDQQERQFLPRCRSRTLPSSTGGDPLSVSLPDIFAASTGKTKANKDTKLKWRGSQNSKESKEYEETCKIDYWARLRECRYLRTCLKEK